MHRVLGMASPREPTGFSHAEREPPLRHPVGAQPWHTLQPQLQGVEAKGVDHGAIKLLNRPVQRVTAGRCAAPLVDTYNLSVT